MKKLVAPILLAVILLAGCTAHQAPPTPSETQAATTKMVPTYTVTIDDGLTWARSLDGTETAAEVSQGLQKIGELVPTLGLFAADNNAIGQDLITLNNDVLGGPANAGASIGRVKAIADDIEAAITRSK